MAVEGRRKDFWLWTQRKHVEREYKDQPDMLWDWMKKTVPSKYAESFTRQIPQEIDNQNAPAVNVLHITYAEPRQIDTPSQIMDKMNELDTNNLSNPEQLEPIVDVECEE